MREGGGPKKLLVIGLDGLMMELVGKFAGEGRMPAMAQLMREGSYSKALASMPVDTPTNWTTIATGADTATHGKTSFYVHVAGRDLDDLSLSESWLSNLCMAETLWDAAERRGKDVIVINYPVAWPPTLEKGIVVGGRGVFGEPEMRLAGPVQWSTDPTQHEAPLSFGPAAGWRGLPECGEGVLDARISAGEGGEDLAWTDGGQVRLGGRDAIATTRASACDLALVASGEGGYDRLLVCVGKDASQPVAALAAGEWTDWIYADYGDAPSERGACRYKLIRLSPDGAEVTLYRTPIVSLRGFAHPESLCGEIVENVGPFLKGFDVTYNPIVWGDQDTAQDHIRMGVTQYVELTAYLAGAKPWDILITQIQFPDHLNHEYVRAIEPTVSGYDAAKAEIAWEQYRLGYAQADRYVGEIIERCADGETLVVVLSDHAAFPMEWNVNNLEKAFLDAGLLVYKKNDGGECEVDWSRTRAYPTPGAHYYVWVNLKGRDPQGIVAPGEQYESVRDEIIELLRGLYDENAGKHPIAVALRREEADILGQGGERCGDVVYFFEKGYDTDPMFWRPHEDQLTTPIFGPWHIDHTGGHSPSFPTTRYSQSSLAAVCFMAGPGIRRGFHHEGYFHLKDVAPTVCHLLGMDPPREACGRVVRELLV